MCDKMFNLIVAALPWATMAAAFGFVGLVIAHGFAGR
jgi:hypothetical protein